MSKQHATKVISFRVPRDLADHVTETIDAAADHLEVSPYARWRRGETIIYAATQLLEREDLKGHYRGKTIPRWGGP